VGWRCRRDTPPGPAEPCHYDLGHVLVQSRKAHSNWPAPRSCRKIPVQMRFRCTLRGLILTLFALASQLGAGASIPATVVQAGSPLADFAVICHANDKNPASHHTAPACQGCFLCAAVKTPVPSLSADPLLPVPSVIEVAVTAPLPLSRAPPAPHKLAAPPRGPPAVV
jgi:hypothetical protein